jgi:NifB/MoaA-like Fe-S oxidoreductase
LATFDEHINQAKRNLAFLESINHNVKDCIDWQVTVCFYTALHLINAHLATFELQYRKHVDVKNALNPENNLSISKLPEDEYVAYATLQMLSRRSRYLVNEKDNQVGTTTAFLTHDIHLAKSIKHLDRLVAFFQNKYKVSLPSIAIKCPDLKSHSLKIFSKKD